MFPFSRTKIVDLSTDIAGAFCSKILAQAGASVVRLERPNAGPPTTGPGKWRTFLHHEKNVSVLASDATAAANEISRQLADADCVLVGTSGSLRNGEAMCQCDALLGQHPALMCACTSPFGHTGPYSKFRGGDLTLSALGGFAFATPGLPDWQPDGEPPAQSLVPIMELATGAVAAVAIQGALFSKQQGRKTPRHIEISGFEVVAWLTISEWGLASYGGVAPGRRRKSRNIEPNCFLPCKDGYLTIIATTDERWRRLVDIFGSPAWALEERFATTVGRAAHAEELHAHIAAWAMETDGNTFMKAAQARGLPCTAYRELGEIESEEHLGFVKSLHRVGETIFPQDPVRVDGSRRALPGERPVGQAISAGTSREKDKPASDATSGPAQKALSGIRVLDLTQMVAGPLCGQYLATLGADVVLIESRRHLVSRAFGPFGGKPEHDASTNFNHVNRGKRSVELDLTTDKGRELLSRLIAESDVVLENFSLRAAKKLRLDYESLAASNPKIILASISAFGRTGPWGSYVSHHAGVACLSGLTSVIRDEQNRPRIIGAIYPDVMTGTYTAGAIVQALAERERTGRGCALDVSMLDVMLNCMGGLVVEGRSEWPNPPRGFFATGGDDGFVAVDGVDPADAPAVGAQVQSRTRHEAMQLMQAAGRPAGAVLDALEVMKDEHLHARGFLQELDHPAVGKRTLAGVPWLLDGDRPALGVAPALGSATVSVMQDIAVLDSNEIGALQRERVLW